MSDPKSPAESSTTDGLTDGLTSEPTSFDVLLEAAMRESNGRSKRPMTPSFIEEPRKHCNLFEGGWEHSDVLVSIDFSDLVFPVLSSYSSRFNNLTISLW